LVSNPKVIYSLMNQRKYSAYWTLLSNCARFSSDKPKDVRKYIRRAWSTTSSTVPSISDIPATENDSTPTIINRQLITFYTPDTVEHSFECFIFPIPVRSKC
jgi:hypothetical protein